MSAVTIDSDRASIAAAQTALAAGQPVSLSALAAAHRRVAEGEAEIARADRAAHAERETAQRMGVSMRTLRILRFAELGEQEMNDEMRAEGYPVYDTAPLVERTETLINSLRRDLAEKGTASLVSGKRYVDYHDPVTMAVREALPQVRLLCEYDLYD